MIKITRSFSLKRQVKQFEPCDWFCSVEMEVEEKDVKKMSAKLAKFCQEEVEKSEQEYLTPPTKVGTYDEYAPAKIVEEPVWKKYKKDLSKMYGPGIENKDIATNAMTDAELSTETELSE